MSHPRKETNMKKTMAALLALLMMLGCIVSLPVSAEGEAEGEGFTFSSDRLAAWQTALPAYGARYSADPADWWAEAKKGISLQTAYVYPDHMNTGHVTPKEELTEFSAKYPDVPAKTSTWTWNGTTYTWTKYTVTDAVAAQYGNCFEGFCITDGYITFSTTEDVLLRDFYLDAGEMNGCGIRTAISDAQGQVYLYDAELEGSSSALLYGPNITAVRCYLHDVWADHVKGFSGQRFVSCFFCTGGLNGGNPHPDCFQFSVDDSHGGPRNTDSVYLYGNRIDAMRTGATVTNACVILKSEFGGGVSDIQIRQNWINGGACPIQIGSAAAGYAYYENVAVCDNLFGYGAQTQSMFSYTGVYADMLRSKTDTSGNRRLTSLSAGGAVWTADGVRATDMASFAGENRAVTVCLSNHLTSVLSGYVRVSLCDSTGQVRKWTDAPFSMEAYIPWQQYSGIADFRYEDQPLDIPVTLTVPTWEVQDGDFYTVSVVTLPQNGAADIIQSVSLSQGAQSLSHAITLPAGRLPIEQDATRPSIQFLQAVEACVNSQGAERRDLLVAACRLYGEADDTTFGVVGAKTALDKCIEEYNRSVSAINETMQNGQALLRASGPGWRQQIESTALHIMQTCMRFVLGILRKGGMF